MADEKQESKIKVENLPQPEQELTPDEQKQVQGGTQAGFGDGSVRGVKTNVNPITDGTSNT
jgi:hypothetical protein